MLNKRFAECHGEIQRAITCPAVGLAVAHHQAIVYNVYVGPHIFIRIIVNSRHQVQNNMGTV